MIRPKRYHIFLDVRDDDASNLLKITARIQFPRDTLKSSALLINLMSDFGRAAKGDDAWLLFYGDRLLVDVCALLTGSNL
jgi:hypothetical protein